MTELPSNSPEKELNPKWAEVIRSAVEISLNEFDDFAPIDFSPITLTGNRKDFVDSRALSELSEKEQEFINQTVRDLLKFNDDPTDGSKAIRTYKSDFYPIGSETPDPIESTYTIVFQTSYSDRDIYLHVALTPDQRVEYMLAPRDFEI
jgi:hypothetical protein